MARIGFGLATSHGPMLSVPWEHWTGRVAADRANPRHFYQGKTYTFDQMVALHKARNLAALLTPEVFRERHGRCQKAIRELGDIFVESKPDVARRKAEKLVVEDDIDVQCGGFLSNICVACMPVCEEHKIVNMITVCFDTVLTTTKCNRYS